VAGQNVSAIDMENKGKGSQRWLLGHKYGKKTPGSGK
jgi:hypothetical protein